MSSTSNELVLKKFDDRLVYALTNIQNENTSSDCGNDDQITNERELTLVYKIVDIRRPYEVDLTACAFGSCNPCKADCDVHCQDVDDRCRDNVSCRENYD